MNRLLNTMRWDIQLQFRNGFYYASAFVALVMTILFRQIPNMNYAAWWPAILMENLAINSFYFMSGLVLLEKGEGTLEYQVVTPLRSWEYMASKVLTLGLLSTLESVLVIIAVSGPHFFWPALIAGIVFLVVIYALYGLIVVVRYNSINEFLLPSVLWTLAYSLPLLYFSDLWPSPILFLHPVQAPMILMRAAFQPVPTWQVVYGVLYSTLWVGIAYTFSRKAFYKFVFTKEGGRKS